MSIESLRIFQAFISKDGYEKMIVKNAIDKNSFIKQIIESGQIKENDLKFYTINEWPNFNKISYLKTELHEKFRENIIGNG